MKQSEIEISLNKYMIFIFVSLLIFALIGAGIGLIYSEYRPTNVEYFKDHKVPSERYSKEYF